MLSVQKKSHSIVRPLDLLSEDLGWKFSSATYFIFFNASIFSSAKHENIYSPYALVILCDLCDSSLRGNALRPTNYNVGEVVIIMVCALLLFLNIFHSQFATWSERKVGRISLEQK